MEYNFFGPDDVVECLQANISVRKSDGNTALHLAVWNRGKRYYHPAGRWYGVGKICKGCDVGFHRVKIVKKVLESYSDAADSAYEIVHLRQNDFGITPFLLACAAGCDTIILEFLSLLGNRKSIPLDKLADQNANNIFHYILSSSTYFMPSTRPAVLNALIKKISCSRDLINSRNKNGSTPLQLLLIRNFPSWQELIELVRIMLANGADPNVVNSNGDTFLCMAIKNETIVELLLRAGCNPDLKGGNKFSPLSRALNRQWRIVERPSIRVIEMLLAYGVNLSNEAYLHSDYDDQTANVNEWRNIKPDILDALRKVHRSGIMLSLLRICRTNIRRHLKFEADRVILNLTCLPGPLKVFLMVEDEPRVLGLYE